MSVQVKNSFVEELQERMEDILSVKAMRLLTAAVNDILNDYELEHINSDSVSSSDLIDAFLQAKGTEGRSKKTLKHYRYILEKIFKSVSAPASRITVYDLRQFLVEEEERGIGDKTRQGMRDVMSSFFGWCHNEGLIKTNPTSNLGSVKCRKVIRQPFSSTDIQKLREACSCSRDVAIIDFLLATGCRISEAVELNIDDIDFHNMECVVHGKGNKERTVFLNEVALMHLRRYLNDRTDPFAALFVGKGSERMTPGGIRLMLHNTADRAGVEDCHPHRFRRTLATGLIDRGMTIQEVASILGHDNIQTTTNYIYVNKTNVKNSYIKYA